MQILDHHQRACISLASWLLPRISLFTMATQWITWHDQKNHFHKGGGDKVRNSSTSPTIRWGNVSQTSQMLHSFMRRCRSSHTNIIWHWHDDNMALVIVYVPYPSLTHDNHMHLQMINGQIEEFCLRPCNNPMRKCHKCCILFMRPCWSGDTMACPSQLVFDLKNQTILFDLQCWILCGAGDAIHIPHPMCCRREWSGSRD